ncbi:MAG: hypothetical protein GY720_19570 [bacterium]|nr:hypothetical protein [bacterium]
MERVRFTSMADGTREEYEFLARRGVADFAKLPQRVFALLFFAPMVERVFGRPPKSSV